MLTRAAMAWVACGVIAATWAIGPGEADAQQRYADPKVTYSVSVAGSPSRGPRSAKVTLVVACFYGGPYCRRLQPTLRALRTHYRADLRIVYKTFLVYGSRGEWASLAACAARRQGKFDVVDRELWKLPHGTTYSRAEVENIARAANMRMRKFNRDMTGPCKKQIATEQQELRAVGVRGTPASYVNGRYLSGAQPISSFRRLIDEEKKKADRAIVAGTRQSRYYQVHVVNRGVKQATAQRRRPVRPVRRRLDAKETYAIAIAGAPSYGSDPAPLTVALACSFRSRNCDRALERIATLTQDFAGKVKVVLKYSGWQEEPEDLLALCAADRQGALVMMVEAWRQQRKESGYLNRQTLRQLAADLGLDMARFDGARGGGCKTQALKDRDELRSLFGRTYDAIFVNGRYVPTYASYDRVKKLADSELKLATKRLKNTQLRAYYRTWVLDSGKKGVTPPRK